MRKKWQTDSYKMRILTGLLVMCALPILVLSIFSYTAIRHNIRRQMDLMAVSLAEGRRNETEKLLENLKVSYMEIAVSDSFRAFRKEEVGYKDYGIYSDIMDQMKGPAYLQEYIKGYSLINFKTGWVLSSRGMYRFEDADNKEEVEQLLEADPYRTAYLVNHRESGEESMSLKKTKNLPHNTIDQTGVFMVFKLPVAEENPECLILLNLDMDAFLPAAKKGDIFELTVLDEDGNILTATDEGIGVSIKECGEFLSVEGNIKTKEGGNLRIGAIETDAGRNRYIVTYDTSVLGKWESTLVNLLITLLVIIAVMTVLFILTGRHVYSPIEQLTSMVEKTTKEEGGKANEIRFIEERVLNLADTVQSQKGILKETLVNGLLNGSVTEEEIGGYLMRLGVGECKVYQAGAVGFQASMEGIEETEQSLILNRMKEVLEKNAGEHLFLVPEIKKKMLLFLFGGRDEEELQIHQREISRVLEECRKELEISVLCMGISKKFHVLRHAYRAGHEAAEAAKAGRPDTMEVFFYEDIKTDTEKTPSYPHEIEMRIRELVDLCQEREACREIDHFMDRIADVDVTQRSYYLYRLLLAVLEVFTDTGMSLESLKKEEEGEMITSFWQAYAAGDVREFLKEKVVVPAVEALREFRGSNSRYVRDAVLKLIRASKGDITLAECAEKLNYSTNYLGRILKCENNSSFSDYVAEQKFVYAKELLEHTQRSVADIAKELNYTNTQNFIRFFNKQAGMSPGKYRQMMTEEVSGEQNEEG